jgi:hypothetical protein
MTAEIDLAVNLAILQKQQSAGFIYFNHWSYCVFSLPLACSSYPVVTASDAAGSTTGKGTSR